jgi:predicted GNAT superfamily acetyltransferase
MEEYPVATADNFPEADAVLVQIPSDLQKLKKTNLDKALEFRMNTRKIFDEYINNRGFAATELFSERIDGERMNYYLLEKMK